MILLGALAAAGPAGAGRRGRVSRVYLLVHLLAPAAMGAGDVKLAFSVGGLTGCFGADVWFLAALAAPLFTAVCGVVARCIGGAATVPHGPSMCLATAVALAMVLM
ncbi:putative membrane protein [Mycobacterium kansasii 732]|nr:putative membrane protein [Mycobacterium kansasii 732]